ncbi:hypothetical protein [Candidatus Nitrospira allomarina]|uniref:Uncharacterized protein n=1 Tax=Candidatus Nitrospira allomarina TaxID=3020900 RepID=A0AA96JXA2_9BACT|nr:hypothetical protein [Candidatus Nitrospira allomarina]WNM56504.1 hypothetical protein PP769_10975 [Candidatus Nitrospira allomarina]
MMTGDLIIDHSSFEKEEWIRRVNGEKRESESKGHQMRCISYSSCEMGPTRKRGTLAPWDYPGEDRLKI